MQRFRRNLVAQYFYSIVFDQLQVRKAGLAGFQESMPDTRLVHFDAEEI